MRTIYFAHDQQENPEVRRHLLEQAGYAVKLLRSYRDLVAALKEKQPDLLLMDALLEGKNGFEAAQEITERTKGRNFPIVLCAQIYRQRAFREEALRCGAQDYLHLPMAPEQFLQRVNQAIGYFVPPSTEKSGMATSDGRDEAMPPVRQRTTLVDEPDPVLPATDLAAGTSPAPGVHPLTQESAPGHVRGAGEPRPRGR